MIVLFFARNLLFRTRSYRVIFSVLSINGLERPLRQLIILRLNRNYQKVIFETKKKKIVLLPRCRTEPFCARTFLLSESSTQSTTATAILTTKPSAKSFRLEADIANFGRQQHPGQCTQLRKEK